MTAANALDDAWQAALSTEHQAVFGYSLLGPRLDAADRARAVSCSDAHEALRDSTQAALARAGRTPVAPQADYPGLYPVPSAASARRLAVRLEDECAAAWRFLYLRAASAPTARGRSLRTTAQDGLDASAVRAAQWRRLVDPTRPTVPFPGI
jgi:hypothetical protein